MVTITTGIWGGNS